MRAVVDMLRSIHTYRCCPHLTNGFNGLFPLPGVCSFCWNFSERQIFWSLCSVDFHTLTLQLPIQTPHSVAPELPSFCEFTQNFSKTSTPQTRTRIWIRIRTQIPVYADTMGKGSKPGADPGFPVGGGADPVGGATWFCQNFPKTAWNRENLGCGGGGAPLDPPLQIWIWVSGNMFCIILCSHRVWNPNRSPNLNAVVEMSHDALNLRYIKIR